MKPIKNVTIIGMGALGTLFGCEIQSKIGRENVAFLMDEARCEKNKTAVYKVNGEPFDFRIISPMEAAPADLIIVSTKATGLTEALDTMAPAVGDETIIISAINGVVSEEILADRFGGPGDGRGLLRPERHLREPGRLLPRDRGPGHAGETLCADCIF